MNKVKRINSLHRNILITLGIPTVFIPGLILASILGWDWQKDLKNIVQTGGYKQTKVIFPNKVFVTNVLDGDTFEIYNGQSVRMIGIDSPNRGEVGYEEAKEY